MIFRVGLLSRSKRSSKSSSACFRSFGLKVQRLRAKLIVSHRGPNNYQYYFRGVLYYKYSINNGPQNLILIIKAPTLNVDS